MLIISLKSILCYLLPMKILHIISQSPDFTGSGKFIQEMIRQSKACGHENYMVAGAQSDFELPEGLIDEDHCIFVRFDGEDLNYPIPGMSDVMPYQSTVFSTLGSGQVAEYKKAFKKKIKHAIDIFSPDILHTHHLWIVSAISRKIAPDIPMVTTCHGTCLRQHYLCPDIGVHLKEKLKKIDEIIALSCDQKRTIAKTIGKDISNINVISGGYNQTFFFHESKTFHGVVEMAYAGKLSTTKGVPWLLKSLEQICDLPFRLHMAGSSSGMEKKECLALARKLGPKVVYHGPLNHDQLGKLLRRSHLFILPSFFEGLPLVLLEALACGCRVITTALPGVKEIFGTDHSAMVKMIDLPELKTIDTPYEKDKKSLENQLAGTLRKSIEAVIKNSEPDVETIKSATSQFTWEKIFSRVETIYTRLLKENLKKKDNA